MLAYRTPPPRPHPAAVARATAAHRAAAVAATTAARGRGACPGRRDDALAGLLARAVIQRQHGHQAQMREQSRARYLAHKPPPKPAPPPAPRPTKPGAPGRQAPSAAEWEQVRKRAAIAHVMRDVGPMIYAFQAEIELQKRFRPDEILANRMTLVAGGIAKILLGSVQLGTAGLSAPITGALTAGVDLATAGARAGLGLEDESAGEAQMTSGTKSLMIASATRAVGPVGAFSLGPGYQAASAVPVLGGAATIVLGAKDVWEGLQGIRLSAGDVTFIRQSIVEIRAMQARITAKAGELARIPELAAAAAAWRECAKALAELVADLTKLLAKQPKSSSPKTETVDAWSAPATRGRSGALAEPLGRPRAESVAPLVMLA